MGKAAMVVNAASPTTTSAPIRPAAASPNSLTSTTLSQITISVDNTTLVWLVISDTTERLNKDIRLRALKQKMGASPETLG